jgi:O-acetyl-ADP-ribose deacetylase (regulator of RNase III)
MRFVVADLLAQDVDALVNAANERLAHGGGVAGAIARAAGPRFLAQSRRLGGCPTGDAVVTGAGDLPQRWVIHAVGPVWAGGGAGEDEALASCHRAVIARARELGVRSIALPAIATGIFGFPAERAAPVAVAAVAGALASAPGIEVVRFCFVDHALCALYASAAEDLAAG